MFTSEKALSVLSFVGTILGISSSLLLGWVGNRKSEIKIEHLFNERATKIFNKQ